MHFLGTSALVRPLPPTSPKCGSETFQVRTLLGCVKVGVYKPLDVLSLTQSNNLNGSIAISNGGSPATNLCWDGSTITGEAELTAVVNAGAIDILIALNSLNHDPVWSESTKTVISTALADGKLDKLLLFDRYANGDVKFPGLPPGSVIRSNFWEPLVPINATASPNVGPAGTVGTWSGCSSNHGYIAPVAPLSKAQYHFRRQPDSNPVSVQFCHNDKLVYYSTVPEDNYLAEALCDSPGGSANKLLANTLWKIATESCFALLPTTYRLWNAATDKLVQPLVNGRSYCIDYPYNIEAQVTCPSLPVGIKLWKQHDGSTIARQKESEAPYYLWGNVGADVKPNPKSKPLLPGVYKVSNLSGGDGITFTQTCTSPGA